MTPAEHPDALVIDGDAPEAEEAQPAKRRKKSTSPTARTLTECRKRGWVAGVVEQFVRFPPPGHRVDLFGVIDIVAIAPLEPALGGVRVKGRVFNERGGVMSGVMGGALVGIQACAGATHAARRDKILAEPRARQWIEAGGRLELWSWAKQGARGKRKTWQLRVEAFTVESWRSA